VAAVLAFYAEREAERKSDEYSYAEVDVARY